MEINSTASGVSIFTDAQNRVQESALQIAKSTTNGNTADLAKPLIELKVAEQQAGAAVKVIEVEGKQIGTLLNLLV